LTTNLNISYNITELFLNRQVNKIEKNRKKNVYNENKFLKINRQKT